MAQVERDVFDRGELLLDERHFPIVIATWVGEITDAGIDAYFRWLDRVLRRAAVQGMAVVPITCLRGARGRVDPGLRERFVQEIDRREAMIGEHVDQAMMVARGAFALGTIAYVLCRMRPRVRLSSFGDLPSALVRALQRLDHAGVERPTWLDPERYQPSAWHRAVA